MKILFISSAYYPATKMGGPLHSVRSLAEHLVARGHEVTVAVSNWDLNDRLDVDTTIDHWVNGVRVRFFDMRPPLLKRLRIPGFRHTTARVAGPDWKRWITDNIASFDLIDIQISFLSLAPLAARLAHTHGKTLFYHQRGVLDPDRLKLKKWRKRYYITLVERPAFKRANVLVALTPYEAESFRLQRTGRPTAVIPNGVDIRYGEGELAPGARIHKLIQSMGKRPVFMWMSRIHTTKGADVFAEAFILAAQKNANMVGIMAGPDEIGLEATLKQRIAKANLQDRFHFTGPLSGDDKLAMLRRCDVFTFPTMSEGFSMVLLEALACRCAVLTSPGAYFNEIQENGAGWIVERTPQAYADAMLRLLENDSERITQFSAQAQKLVREKYSWDIIADKYQKLALEQSTKQHPPRRS